MDYIMTSGWWSAFDVEWEDPAIRLFYQELASNARFIHFDRRGAGASDQIPIDSLPPLEAYADEIEAVMDALGSEEAVVIGAGSAGPAAMLFAATRPERTKAMVLYQTTAKIVRSDDYPAGIEPAELAESQALVRDTWGTGEALRLLFPSRAGNDRFLAWYAKVQRSITSPKAARALLEAEMEVDVRSLLPSISVPTLVIHRTDSPIYSLEMGRYLASEIAGAQLVEIPGGDLAPFWDRPELTLDAVHEFMTGVAADTRIRRQLATLLFTDIVDSTVKAEQLGDRRWLSLLEVHDEVTKDVITAHDGRMVKQTGDGVLALFDGPGRALRAAERLCAELARASIEIRVGVHTGEIESRADDVGGLAVHLAARIMGLAEPGEILVSRTVKDLVVGSNFEFADRGTHSLKGVEGKWQLYRLEG